MGDSFDSNTRIVDASRLEVLRSIELKICASYFDVHNSNKDTAGELYTIDIRYKIAEPLQKRHKRLFDAGLSCLFLLVAPILLLFFVKKERVLFIKNTFSVLFGSKTWIGYSDKTLPRLKPSVFSPADAHRNNVLSDSTKTRLNFLYAKDYAVSEDWELLCGIIYYL